jgi:hypothetical protein
MIPAREHGAKLFFGAKAAGGIPLASSLMEDALIQASLDPEIEKIERLAISNNRESDADFVVLHRAGQRLVLDVARRKLRDAADEKNLQNVLAELRLDLLRRSHSDILREPLFSNCGIVWSYRDHRVAVGDRIRIMQMLADEGPLRIGDLVGDARFRGDPSAALMALACHDVVEIDLRTAVLGPETKVRIRRRND